MSRKFIPWSQQRARAAELDDLRCQRPLTAAERAEAENLSSRLYMRQWRAANYGTGASGR